MSIQVVCNVFKRVELYGVIAMNPGAFPESIPKIIVPDAMNNEISKARAMLRRGILDAIVYVLSSISVQVKDLSAFVKLTFFYRRLVRGIYIE